MKIPNVVEYAHNRCVRIKTDEHHGTGVIIHTNFVLSCFHCLEVGSEVLVNGQEARIVVVSPKEDLMLLMINSGKFEPIQFAEASLGQKVFYVGNPGTHENIAVGGYIVDMNERKLFIDGTIRAGASGSGLYTNEGLVGLVDALEVRGGQTSFGVGTQSSIIQKFIRESLLGM